MQNSIPDWSNHYDTIEDVREDIFDVTYDLEEDQEFFFIYKDKFYAAYKIEDEDGDDDEHEFREVTEEYVDENTSISTRVVFTTTKRKPKTIFPVRKSLISKLK